MNDYCAKEPTMCGEPVAREITVKDGLQETNKILRELMTTLDDMLVNVCGDHGDNELKSDATCLAQEARQVTGIAYECLQRANRLRSELI